MTCHVCEGRLDLMRPGAALPICDEHLRSMFLAAAIGSRGQYIPIPRPEAVW